MTVLDLKLPRAADVSHIVSELLDRRVTIKPVDPVDCRECVVGIFCNEHGDAGCVVFSDIELANHAGAALSLMPPENALAGIDAREVPEATLENFREVVNVLGTLLNRRDAMHVKLWYVVDERVELPPALLAAMEQTGERADFRVEIEGYGAGHMSFGKWV